MKKKFSFAIVIVLLVSMLTLVLVACDPKDPESFSAVDSMTVLEEIWDAWSVDNFQTATDTLGIDVNVNLKGEGKDINFVLQGGISSNASVKEGLRLAIVNNFANKTIAEVISNSDGTFVYADGLNDKPLKINEIKFQGIGSIINETLGFSVGDLAGLLKMPIINLVNDAINMDGSIITIRPVLKENNLYDVNYTFDFKLNSLIDGLMSFIPGSEEIFESVKAELNDVSIYFDIKTAGNQREKVVKPAKGAPKYNYKGGKLTDMKIAAKVGTSEINVNCGVGGFRLLNSIPAISTPTEFMDFDSFLLPSNLNGTFNLKDKNGDILGNYEYTANFDFNKTQLFSSLIECAVKQSAMPIVDKMFKDESGKIYIEVKHICDNTCTINHLSNDSRPLLTVAYDPNSFGTNRVYFAFNIRGSVGADFAEKISEMINDGTLVSAQEILDLLPKEDLIFSIDPSAYIKKAEVSSTDNIILPQIMAVNDSNTIDFTQIVNSILQADVFAEYKDTIAKVLDIVFPNVESIDYTAVHTNEHITDWDIKAKFLENREFCYSETDGIKDIMAPINSKIDYTFNSQNIIKINTAQDIYNEDGTLKDLTAQDLNALIGASVEGKYFDMLNNQITENLTILDIVGLDIAQTQTTQTVYLVVGGSVNNNIYRFLDNINDLFGTEDKKLIDYIYPISGVIELEIKLI